MSGHPLYRAEALKNRQAKSIGKVILAHPLSFSILTLIALSCALAMVLILIFGEYTKKVGVSGQIVPSGGLLTIYARQAGIVVKKNIHEGETVGKGHLLFEISSEIRNKAGSTREQVTRQMNLRHASIIAERASVLTLHEREKKLLVKRGEALKIQVSQLEQQIAKQKNRVDLAKRDLSRYDDLVNRNYVSRDMLMQRQSTLLEEESKLLEAEREHTAIATEAFSVSDEIETMKYRHDQQLSSFDRQMATQTQEIVELEEIHEQALVAPQSGILSVVNAELGQRIDSTLPLAVLIPENSRLLAHLFVPSRAIGFIKKGTQVNLRYRTYPYQVFGMARGTVIGVSSSTLRPQQVSTSVIDNSSVSGEPVYLVNVELPSQALKLRGNLYPLQVGMLVDADFLLERKPLYKWIIDPIYGAGRAINE